jgi:hypothetical protein
VETLEKFRSFSVNLGQIIIFFWGKGHQTLETTKTLEKIIIAAHQCCNFAVLNTSKLNGTKGKPLLPCAWSMAMPRP